MKTEQNATASVVETYELSAEPQLDLLELVIEGHEAQTDPASSAPARIDGVLVGKLVSFSATGEPIVDYPGRSVSTVARVMAALGLEDVGREVALLFEGGNPEKPIIMGLMHVSSLAVSRPRVAARPDVEADAEILVLSAEKEIVLRCGDASITLTKAGKILIRGAYVLSRSSGTNRIQGGSVEIN